MAPRFLLPAEFESFRLKFPELAKINDLEHRVAVLQDKDEIVAYAILQMIPHVGAIFTVANRRNQGLMSRLLQFISRRANPVGFFMFPSNDVAKKTCMSAGLTRKDWEVWKKEF